MGACVSKIMEAMPKPVRVGDKCPDFTLDSTKGRLSLYGYMADQWIVLFSHLGALTPICTTEIAAMEREKKEYADRGVKLAALTCDTAEQNNQWIEDSSREVSKLYGMLDSAEAAKGALHLPLDAPRSISIFVIDETKTLRLSLSYPASTGRSLSEILRAVDSLKLTSAVNLGTPEGWTPGGPLVVLAGETDEEAASRLPKVNEVLPYLRLTTDPRESGGTNVGAAATTTAAPGQQVGEGVAAPVATEASAPALKTSAVATATEVSTVPAAAS